MSKNMSESDRGDLAEEQRIDDDCTWRPVESEAREGTTPVVEMTVGEDPFTSRSSSPDVSNYDADKVNVVESSAEPLKLEIAEQESANAVTVADEAPMSTTKESDDSVNENPEIPKESGSEDPETPVAKESGSEDSMIKDDLTKELEKESVTEESAGENGSFAQDQIPGDKQEVSAVPEEPKKSLFEQYIGKSSELKEEGTKLFKSGDLVAAKKKYLEALGYAQYMEVELSNEEKAKVFEIVIPCHTNTAICSLKLKEYADAVTYARNSLLLINAIADNFSGQVWAVLKARGMTEDKLLKETKKKSLYLLAKGEFFVLDTENAVVHFNEALRIILSNALGGEVVQGIPSDSAAATLGVLATVDLQSLTPAVSKEIEEIKEFLNKALKRLATETKKAKSMWSKAFKENNTHVEDDGLSPPTTPSPQPQTPAGKFTLDFSKLDFKSKKESESKDKEETTLVSADAFSWTTILSTLLFGLGTAWYFGWIRNPLALFRGKGR